MGFLRQARFAYLLRRGPKETVGHRQIEKIVAAGVFFWNQLGPALL